MYAKAETTSWSLNEKRQTIFFSLLIQFLLISFYYVKNNLFFWCIFFLKKSWDSQRLSNSVISLWTVWNKTHFRFNLKKEHSSSQWLFEAVRPGPFSSNFGKKKEKKKFSVCVGFWLYTPRSSFYISSIVCLAERLYSLYRCLSTLLVLGGFQFSS